jgi:regulator of protease activity HflC (stomatin/prohibitin superfamily)
MVKVLTVDEEKNFFWKNMRGSLRLAIAAGILLILLVIGFNIFHRVKIPVGFVGVKVLLYGSNKGVSNTEELSPGIYWTGLYTEVFEFPTFMQNYTWTHNPHEGRGEDESITFQTKEGMDVNADIGISYELEPTKVTYIYQKYRKGISEITDIYLRNYVRDALNASASRLSVENVYGEGKAELIKAVQEMVQRQVFEVGIKIDKIYLIGSFRLPENVKRALDSKIQATQDAMRVQNEVMQARAEKEKAIVVAEGQARANKLLSDSITPSLIKLKTIEKWNGALPLVGNSGNIVDVRGLMNAAKSE